jgi:O-succinylbenzoic acid--CoA ligase
VKITRARTERVRWPIEATGAARGRTERAAILLEIVTDTGHIGLGEAAPLETSLSPTSNATMESLDAAAAALAAFCARVPFDVATDAIGALALFSADIASPSARMAVETALLDAQARVTGVPVASLLRATASSVECAVVVDDPAAARRAILDGARTLKIKVGPSGDVERVLAIHRAAPDATLRLDANRSWPRDRVLTYLRALAELPIEYVEEPCVDSIALLAEPLPLSIALDESLAAFTRGDKSLAAVARDDESRAAVARIDESARSAAHHPSLAEQRPAGAPPAGPSRAPRGTVAPPSRADLARALASPNLAALVIKPTVVGGITAARALAAEARAAGKRAVITHALEGPIGTAACAALALSLADATVAAGLAPHGALAAWPVTLPYLGASKLHANLEPGLGLERATPLPTRLDAAPRIVDLADHLARVCERVAQPNDVAVVTPARSLRFEELAGSESGHILVRTLGESARASLNDDGGAAAANTAAESWSTAAANTASTSWNTAAASADSAAAANTASTSSNTASASNAAAAANTTAANIAAPSPPVSTSHAAPSSNTAFDFADIPHVALRAVLARPTLDTIRIIHAALAAKTPIALVHPRLSGEEIARQQSVIEQARVPADTAFVLFTSGSTGIARGVVLSHAAIEAAAAASWQHLGARSTDRWLLALPMAHAGGLNVVVRCRAARIPLVLLEGDFDRARCAELLDQCTLASLVPTQLAAMLDDPAWRPPAKLRAVLLGGAAAAPSLLAAATARGVPYLTSYGLTETFGQIATAPLGHAGDANAPLVPLAGVNVFAGTRAAPATIRMISPTLATCYLGGTAIAPELTTADLGFLEDGAVHIVGRADDVIITGGENVHPLAIEAVLTTTLGVRAAVAFGVPSERWGQIVGAALVVDAAFDRDKAIAYWREHLPAHARPRELAIVDALPLLANGKLDRRSATHLPRVVL